MGDILALAYFLIAFFGGLVITAIGLLTTIINLVRKKQTKTNLKVIIIGIILFISSFLVIEIALSDEPERFTDNKTYEVKIYDVEKGDTSEYTNLEEDIGLECFVVKTKYKNISDTPVIAGEGVEMTRHIKTPDFIMEEDAEGKLIFEAVKCIKDDIYFVPREINPGEEETVYYLFPWSESYDKILKTLFTDPDNYYITVKMNGLEDYIIEPK